MTDNGPAVDHEGLLTGDLGYEWEENYFVKIKICEENYFVKIKTCVKKTALLRLRSV